MELQSTKTLKIPLDDDKIIELYWQRDEEAIEATDFKYRKYLYKIAYNIVRDNVDCEECLNDTYLGSWNAIPPSKPSVLKAFLTTIKRYHNNLRKKVIPSEMTVSLSELEDFIVGDEDVGDDFDAVKLGEIISNFVRCLSEREKFIFMSRYYLAEPIDIIARNLGLSRSTINKELAAIRSALKEKLESEGYLI